MPTTLICPGCQARYTPKPTGPGKRIRCPACSAVHPSSSDEVSASHQKSKGSAGGIKCPGCKRSMAPGVNYCVACNISLFDAWGDAEECAESAGRRNQVVGYAELAWKTVRIFLYFITFRWGKIFNEL